MFDDFETAPKRKFFTPQQGLIKAQKYCAYQERCQQEVRGKLYEWGIKKDDLENIISNLISDDFINEERFARAYARGKFRIKKWGRIKIKAALKGFDISSYCIKQAMKEINNEEYISTLKELIKKTYKGKMNTLSLPQQYALAKKIMSKGYEQDIIWDVLKTI